MKSEHIRWMILIVLALIWGSSFILMKKALVHLSPVQVGALRMIFTGMTLIPLGYKGLSAVSKKQWFYIFLTALVGTFIPVFLFAFAVMNILLTKVIVGHPSAIAGLLTLLLPMMQ